VGRRGLDAVHDLREGELISICVRHWSEEEVNVIWHDHRGMEFLLDPVVMDAVL
jgi:hypothetical protein